MGKMLYDLNDDSEFYQGKPFFDLSGQKFGKITVKSYRGSLKRNKTSYWHCECDCGKSLIKGRDHLVTGSVTSCGCARLGKFSHSWKGCGDLSQSYWNRIYHGSKHRGRPLEFSITIEYAWDLFIKQKKRCALTGIELIMEHSDLRKEYKTASLDRVDSSKGYVEGNVQWVHKTINHMKQELKESEFIEFCKLVAKYKD